VKQTATPAAGPTASTAPGTPLIVRSRSRPIVLFALGGAATAAFMVAIRHGGGLDFEEAIMSAGALVLGLWLVAQAGGLLLRRSSAGHAMRLDADGLHHPGWSVVPWTAVHGVRFRRLGGERSLFHLVLDIDPACAAPSHGGYVRWMFGPIEGLWRRPGRPIEIPLIAIQSDPQALVKAVEAWCGNANATRSRP